MVTAVISILLAYRLSSPSSQNSTTAMSAATAASKGKTVLVTGITGFAGSHVALSALRAGYSVRGAVRSLEKAEKWKLTNSGWDDRLTVRNMLLGASFVAGIRERFT